MNHVSYEFANTKNIENFTQDFFPSRVYGQESYTNTIFSIKAKKYNSSFFLLIREHARKFYNAFACILFLFEHLTG